MAGSRSVGSQAYVNHNEPVSSRTGHAGATERSTAKSTASVASDRHGLGALNMHRPRAHTHRAPAAHAPTDNRSVCLRRAPHRGNVRVPVNSACNDDAPVEIPGATKPVDRRGNGCGPSNVVSVTPFARPRR